MKKIINAVLIATIVVAIVSYLNPVMGIYAIGMAIAACSAVRS